IDAVGLLGPSLISKSFSVVIIFVALHLLFFISGVFFALGWDAFSDSARWFRRKRTAKVITSDLRKLREILN
ncbi:MAG: hypothetical protein VW862_00885, partial [Euryarchaeota archaeon]